MWREAASGSDGKRSIFSRDFLLLLFRTKKNFKTHLFSFSSSPPPQTLLLLQGTVPDVFARALRGLAGAKLARAGAGPSAFRAADGESSALRASFKADDGYLYPLDRAFFYAPKPPTLLQFDDIAGVEFVRRGGGVLAASQKTFDLAVRVRDGAGGNIEHTFRGIAKQEWAGLFEFLKAKGIRIDNLRDAAAGAGGGGRGLDLGALREGGGGDDDDDDSGEDEEFKAGSETESSDEESDSADDDESGGEGGEKSAKKSKKKKRSSASPSGDGTPATAAKKKQKRKQAPREAGAPKKPMAAYMHFSNAKRAEVMAANPALTFGEVGKATGELWRSLDADGKKEWEEAAAKDKARFAEEEAAWQAGKKAKGDGGGGGGGEGEEKEGE